MTEFYVGDLFNHTDPIYQFDRDTDEPPASLIPEDGTEVSMTDGVIDVPAGGNGRFWLFQPTGSDDDGKATGLRVSIELPAENVTPANQKVSA
jgi:hypothetical protein